jgi:flagellar biosynthesis protein FlhF
MKIKHYRAADMRTALRQVRDAQGPDAVILSSRRVPGGVEVVAAIDYDGEDAATDQLAAGMGTAGSNVSYGAGASALSGLVDTYGADRRQAQDQSVPARAAQHDPALFGGVSKGRAPQARSRAANEYMSERAELTRQFASNERAQQPNRYIADDRDAGAERAPAKYTAASERGRYAVEAEPARDVDLSQIDLIGTGSDVNEELRTLRRMLETQLATLAWNDLSRRSPIQT